jgi:hypothetical protein
MALHFHTLLGNDELNGKALGLLSSSIAHTTYANYDNNLRHFFTFCTKENIHPLHVTPSTMVRYKAWFGLQGTIAAAALR